MATLVTLFATVPTLCSADPEISIKDLCSRLRSAGTMRGSFAGTEVVTLRRVGISEPDMGNYVVEGFTPDGEYRWYVHEGSWWMVKTVPIPKAPGKWAGTNRYIVRSYRDKVLSNDDFQRDSGEHRFLSGHLDTTEYRAVNGPAIGRRWTMGLIAGVVESMTRVKLVRSKEGIEIDGLYKGTPLSLTVAPKYGYLATRLMSSPATDKFGYVITKVKCIEGVWMPELVDLYNGQYENDQLVHGSSGQIRFSNFASHPPPSQEEAPTIPPNSILGGDDDRIYKMAQDGTLVDLERAGYSPVASLAYGDVFVLSGAGLLLGSLSWLVFRKRRTPSPLRGRGGRG